jgi:hypothetical protein
MIEVKVETVQASWVFPHRVIVLKELDAERYLPIWIGAFEAEAISMRLLGHKMPRPLTHDLLVNIIETLDAELIYIYVNALTNNVFYARLILEFQGQEIEVDARPSDAVAIAVRCEVPIYVAEEVLEEAGVEPEPSILEEELYSDSEAQGNYDVGAFNEFLRSLNLDDLESS